MRAGQFEATDLSSGDYNLSNRMHNQFVLDPRHYEFNFLNIAEL